MTLGIGTVAEVLVAMSLSKVCAVTRERVVAAIANESEEELST